jgi:NADPH:quinone reductase-like Zn-dependent oxidoreductase
MNTSLLVRKDQLSSTRLLEVPQQPLSEGQVRVRVEAFGLTSNNISYAAFGHAMDYWRFFPAEDAAWGIVPVWGFATVVQSTYLAVAVGERLYGYWPMAEFAVLSPQRVSPNGFSDGAAHRAGLPSVYNQYARIGADPFYRANSEGIQALLRPLFTTSWLIDDFMADNGFFGANTLLLSSASSKTAYGAAHALQQRQGIEVIGLTSTANVRFCQDLGCYHRVLSYEQLDQVAESTACVFVDFAGNTSLRGAVHARFPGLAYSCSIGGTHVDQLGGTKGLPGPRPVLFFAPARIEKRHADWGEAEFSQRLVQAWQRFTERVTQPASPWLVVQHHLGPQAVQAAYAQVLAGRGDARVGHLLSFLT